MAEDWRLTVSLTEGFGHTLGAALRELELEDETRALLGDRIAVSAEADRVFLYADSREAEAQAEALISQILVHEAAAASFTLERWHPLEEEWEAADVPLPATEAQLRQERERHDAKDAADSAAAGYAEWEVRLDLPSHREAAELARRLEAEGFSATRRWRYLLIGAASIGEAQSLAERLGAEAPAGTELQVQPGGEMTWEAAPTRPFPLFVLPS